MAKSLLLSATHCHRPTCGLAPTQNSSVPNEPTKASSAFIAAAYRRFISPVAPENVWQHLARSNFLRFSLRSIIRRNEPDKLLKTLNTTSKMNLSPTSNLTYFWKKQTEDLNSLMSIRHNRVMRTEARAR
jgi:hypothetical protein